MTILGAIGLIYLGGFICMATATRPEGWRSALLAGALWPVFAVLRSGN